MISSPAPQGKSNTLADIMQSIYPLAAREGVMNAAPIQTPQQEQQGLAALMPREQPAPPPWQDTSALQQKRPVWKDLLGGVLDTLAIAGGREGGYWPEIVRQQQEDEKARQRLKELMFQRETKLAELNRPQYFMSGRDRVAFDPTTGESGVVYQGTPDFQEYASNLGYEPGSDEYNSAMQDFVLRSYGPTAQQGKIGLEGVRQQNRVTLRQTPTYTNTHPRPASGGGGGNRPPRNTGNVYAPILAKVAAGRQLSLGEQSLYNIYSRNRGGNRAASSGSATAPQTATDPKTGRKVQWNGKAWAPLN